MAHRLVEIAGGCLVETRDGLALAPRARPRLARAVDEWARLPDDAEARGAISELMHFAVHLSERFGAVQAAQAVLDIACRAVPILTERVHEEESRRAAEGKDYRLQRRAPMIDQPGVNGTLPAFALLQHRSRRRRA